MPDPMQTLRDLAAAPELSPAEIELVKSMSDLFFDYLKGANPLKESAAQVALSVAATAFVAIVNQTSEELTYLQVQTFFQNVSLSLQRELTHYLLETLAKDPS